MCLNTQLIYANKQLPDLLAYLSPFFWHFVPFQKHVCYYILSLLRIKTKDLSNQACLFCPYRAFLTFILQLFDSTAVYFIKTLYHYMMSFEAKLFSKMPKQQE